MFTRIKQTLIGSFSIFLYFLNTLFWVPPVVLLSLVKLLFPIKAIQTFITKVLNFCASAWISCNNLNQRVTSGTRIQVKGIDELSLNDWYLVIANHQSWVDILVLQRIFNRRIPFLKFFLKKELIWVPILGVAWWALDFPFMRRYSKSVLAKHPHLKGKDMETTRKACAKFKYTPVSVMNFVEGTRFTPEKHDRQSSPFNYLLKPRAGGIAFVLNAMGDHLHKLIDVTIKYPAGVPSYWDFACGKVKDIQVEIIVTPIKTLFQQGVFGPDMATDPEQRARFQQWLNQKWQSKDKLLESM